MPLDLHWDLGVSVPLGLALAAFVAAARLRARATGSPAVTPRQMMFFSLGVFTLWLAQGTPLDDLADNYLFAAHMLQHDLICFVAPPLLLLGAPQWLLRPLVRPRLVRWLVSPVPALVIFNLLFSVYHFPGVYELGLRNDGVHFLEHAVLFVSALCMWWPVVSPLPEVASLWEPLLLFYLFLMMIGETVVFGLVTFAPHALFPTYVSAPRLWGLTPLEDQQLGGAMMQIIVMAAITPFAVNAFTAWFRRENHVDPLPAPQAELIAECRADYHRTRPAARIAERPGGGHLRVVRGGQAEAGRPGELG